MRTSIVASIVAVAALAGQRAEACMTSAPLVLEDVQYADTVVVGRITDYRVIPDERRPGGIGDYARFDIEVDTVLKGEPPRTISATWDNSTFGEPDEIAPGRYLIALRHAGSRVLPPLRGASATILSNPDDGVPSVLQAPCSDAFIFPNASKEAAALHKILKQPRRPNSEP